AVLFSISPAGAQVAAGNYGKSQGASVDPNINACTAFSVRENYFKRFPFAKKAFDMDQKSIIHRGVIENNGNQSFLDGLFGGDSPDWLGGLFGGDEPTTTSSPTERLQRSDPPSAPQMVNAYPFFIKFCNDNPYQGVCYWQFGVAMDKPAAARD